MGRPGEAPSGTEPTQGNHESRRGTSHCNSASKEVKVPPYRYQVSPIHLVRYSGATTSVLNLVPSGLRKETDMRFYRSPSIGLRPRDTDETDGREKEGRE